MFIDLDDVLENVPVVRMILPMKYLGLPLSVGRLRKVDFQTLADKAAEKLSRWKGHNITKAGRVALTKLVLSTQPVYHLTTLHAPKEILESIDSYRKKFLWSGDEILTGGKCQVN